MRTLSALTVVGLCFFVSSASAQQEKGDVELQFAGSLHTTVGDSSSSGLGLFQAKLGVFVTDNLQVGIYPSVIITISELNITGVGGTEAEVGLGVFTTYSFLGKGAITVPYVGVQYFQTDISEGFDQNSGSVGVNAGLKFYLSSKTAFDVGANYLFSLDNAGRGTLLFQVGLGVLL